MFKPFQIRILTILAGVCVLLAFVNVMLYFSNGALEDRAEARMQYIEQAKSIGSLYRQVAQALAHLAIAKNDPDVKNLLTSEGFNLTPSSSATGSEGKQP